MKQFRCGDVVPKCDRSFEAVSADEILVLVEAHAKADHGVSEVSAELEAQVRRHLMTAPA